MISLILALVPLQLDGLVAATAAPTIAGELGGFGQIAWIATTYLLTMAVGTITAGRIGDMFGRKTTLLTALLIFLAGSAAAGLAGSMAWLITARAIQGLGGGMVLTTLMAVIADVAPPDKRSRYQSVMGAVAPISMIIGPWIGGLVTEHLGWRWIFLLNLPLVTIAVIGVAILLKLPSRRTGGRVDIGGLTALSIASTAIVLAMTWGGHQYAWDSPQVIGAAVVGLLALLALLIIERRTAHPVMPPQLFGNRAVLVSMVIMFLSTGAIMMAAMNYLPIFLQLVQGQSASNSGLLLLPMLLSAIAVSMITGLFTTQPGRFRPALIIGTSVLAVACGLLATMDTGTSSWLTGAYMALVGVGLGMLFQTPLVLIQNASPAGEVGAATGSAMFLRTIGGSIGVGALGSLFTGTLAGHLTDHGAAAGRTDPAALTPAQVHGLPDQLQQLIAQATAAGTSAMFWAACAAAVVAVVAALLVPRLVGGHQQRADEKLIKVEADQG
ncbi:MFS transporter [Microlunatus elymi]|nr:MFS transporter [Microlunatus elymi]